MSYLFKKALDDTLEGYCYVCLNETKETMGGGTHRIYYGHKLGHSEEYISWNVKRKIDTYQIVGSREVFVCDNCLQADYNKSWIAITILGIVVIVAGIFLGIELAEFFILPIFGILITILGYYGWRTHKKLFYDPGPLLAKKAMEDIFKDYKLFWTSSEMDDFKSKTIIT